MIRRPPRSTLDRSSAASDVYKRQILDWEEGREEGLRGDNLFTAGFKTFADILLVRLEAWGRFMGRHYRPILVMAMASTFALALSLGLKQSVWFDESYSIMLAKSSIPDLFRLTGVDAHPPFYYLLLKSWTSIFGYSELALRSLSALLALSLIHISEPTRPY